MFTYLTLRISYVQYMICMCMICNQMEFSVYTSIMSLPCVGDAVIYSSRIDAKGQSTQTPLQIWPSIIIRGCLYSPVSLYVEVGSLYRCEMEMCFLYIQLPLRHPQRVGSQPGEKPLLAATLEQLGLITLLKGRMTDFNLVSSGI